jgi:hypothetical protein
VPAQTKTIPAASRTVYGFWFLMIGFSFVCSIESRFMPPLLCLESRNTGERVIELIDNSFIVIHALNHLAGPSRSGTSPNFTNPGPNKAEMKVGSLGFRSVPSVRVRLSLGAARNLRKLRKTAPSFLIDPFDDRPGTLLGTSP